MNIVLKHAGVTVRVDDFHEQSVRTVGIQSRILHGDILREDAVVLQELLKAALSLSDENHLPPCLTRIWS